MLGGVAKGCQGPFFGMSEMFRSVLFSALGLMPRSSKGAPTGAGMGMHGKRCGHKTSLVIHIVVNAVRRAATVRLGERAQNAI